MINSIIKQFNSAGGSLSIPEIKGDKDYSHASDSILFLRRYFNIAENARKKETSPLLQKKKEIDGEYAKFTKPLEKTIAAIKDKMYSYSVVQKQAQLALEKELLDKSTEDVVCDILDVQKSKGEFSSNAVKTITKYRIKDPDLQFIDIPVLRMKEYLKTNQLPSWIESFEEGNITIRKQI